MRITHSSTKRRLLRIGIAVIVLVIILVGVALLMVWMGGAEDIADTTPKKTETNKPTKTSKPPDENAVPFAAREYLTSPVSPGTNAVLNIKTLATAKCTIKIVYRGVESTDSGLQEKVADEVGNVSWSWSVPSEAPEGSWPIDIYCYYRDKSAYLRESLTVKKDLTP